MLKSNMKRNIGKRFLFCICIICLIFTALGISMEHSAAVEMNETVGETEMGTDIDLKLENSQTDELSDEDNQNSEVLSDGNAKKTRPFASIKSLVENANPGDTINLDEYYYAEDSDSYISVYKRLNFVGSSTVLDGKGISYMFRIFEGGARSTFTNIKFINGNAEIGSAIVVLARDVVIENCDFENNHCCKCGAVTTSYDLDISKGLEVKNCNFINNSAYYPDYAEDAAAGALAVFGRDSLVSNCVFESNYAISRANAYGGAIQVGLDKPGSNVRVDNCIFRNNRAIGLGDMSHGGAGCVRQGCSYTNCLFINNSAHEGGALTFHSSGSVINDTFINNSAKQYGGALSTGLIYETMELTVENSYFEGNTAPKGGAIQAFGLNIDILDSNFKGNNVTTYGGAIAVEAEDVRIANSKFNSNNAEVDGGAIYIVGKNTQVEKSSFTSNNAIPDTTKTNDGLGGAIYVDSSQATISDNFFMYNTARNGSAIYYGPSGENLVLLNNTLYQNQAWSYQLPIYVRNIYYGDDEQIKVVFYGGNNIADFDNLAVSNAIYNSVSNTNIEIDGQIPVYGATDSGELYQDGREYNVAILLTVQHEDGTVVYNQTGHTSYLGEIILDLENLKPGRYSVLARHYEDTYYKALTNVSSFVVSPKVDNRITKSVNKKSLNYEDIAVWTITLTNLGPNKSTGIVISDVLPEGLVYVVEGSDKRYDPKTGTINIDELDVNQTLAFDIVTVVNKTGEITNEVNVTCNEFDSDLTNNYDDESVFVNPAADMAVVKTVDDENPNYRDTIVWTVKVTNNGPDDAHNVSLSDLLPKGLIFVESDGNYDETSGIWGIGTLENGQSRQLHITCIVNKTGACKNGANVTASEFDYDLTNNYDEKAISVDPSCDLEIVKTVNATSVNYQDLVKWTLTITNRGPDTAHDVEIADTLSDGFIYMDSTRAYVNGKFSIESMAVGEKVIIGIITKANVTGNAMNMANVTCREYDYNLTNNEDDESITVNPASDLEVIKRVSNENPKYNQSVTWTVKVTNNGPDVAHNVNIRDLLPNSLVWSGDDSAGHYNPATGVLKLDKLDVGETFTLKIDCIVNGTGSIDNRVNVSADEYDYNLTNNVANKTIVVGNSADVSVVKSVNNSSPKYNDLVVWTLTINNKGPDQATNVYIEDVLPEGLEFISYTATKGIYDNGMWAMCCLNKTESQSLELLCRVTKTGRITNIATIHADEYDENPDDNEDDETIDVPLAVDIAVTVTTNSSKPLFGESVKWIITIRNNGPDNATNVVLADLIPDELEYSGYESTKGKFDGSNWDVGSLNVGEVQYLNITSIPKALGKILNAASASSREYDWNMSNNNDSDVIDVRSVADLSITKSVDNPAPNYGEYVIWTLVVCNNGPNSANNVVVNDALPAGLKLVSSDGDYNEGIWKVGSLDVNQQKELKIMCMVTSSGNITNLASVSSDEYDPDLSNNRDEESIAVKPACDLSVKKTASGNHYAVGDVIEYVIEVTNNGPDTAHNVKVNEISDDLLKLESFELSKGVFDKSANVWSIDSLLNGESARLIIKAIATGLGIIENRVSATSDTYDYDLSNNNDSAVVDVDDDGNKKPDASGSDDDDSGMDDGSESDGDDNDNNNMDDGSGQNNGDGGDDGSESDIDNGARSSLKNHSTANPFWNLVLVLLFSLIFLEGNNFKRR